MFYSHKVGNESVLCRIWTFILRRSFVLFLKNMLPSSLYCPFYTGNFCKLLKLCFPSKIFCQLPMLFFPVMIDSYIRYFDLKKAISQSAKCGDDVRCSKCLLYKGLNLMFYSHKVGNESVLCRIWTFILRRSFEQICPLYNVN
jgi:hypothetical protein